MLFKPSVVKIGNPRLVYILNGKYVLIMRLTTIDATYISNIELPISKDVVNIDLKIYQDILTIVIGEIGVILKYHTANAYNPLIIQTHILQNQTISFPLRL
jgi:D-ribose pyranose/furanose isomerase RbsD